MNKVVLGYFANIETPQAPPPQKKKKKNKIFEKKKFFHLFYNSSKFLEQLLFLGKMHFFKDDTQPTHHYPADILAFRIFMPAEFPVDYLPKLHI